MFLSVDGTALVQLINFAIFFLIVRALFLQPVGEALRKRREYIDGVKADSDRYRGEIKGVRAEAEARRGVARREAQELIAATRAGADAEAMEIAARFTENANVIAAEARQTIEAEMQSARERGKELARTLGRSLLERAVGSTR